SLNQILKEIYYLFRIADTIQWQLVRSKLRVVGKMLDNDFGKVTMDEGTTFGAAAPDILSWFEQADESNNTLLDDNANESNNHPLDDSTKSITQPQDDDLFNWPYDYDNDISVIDLTAPSLNSSQISQTHSNNINIVDLESETTKKHELCNSNNNSNERDAEYDESIWQCWDQKDYSTHWLKYTNFGIMPPDYVISDPGYTEYISQFSKPSPSVASPCTIFPRRDNSKDS
ncbi:24342_t:CDS:1, partial [Racocetra persica]